MNRKEPKDEMERADWREIRFPLILERGHFISFLKKLSEELKAQVQYNETFSNIYGVLNEGTRYSGNGAITHQSRGRDPIMIYFDVIGDGNGLAQVEGIRIRGYHIRERLFSYERSLIESIREKARKGVHSW